MSVPRRGTYVVRLSHADAADLGLVRALLEGFAVRVACQNPDENLVAQLRAQVDEMLACRLPDDLPRLIQIDLAFHKLLVERSGSPRIVELFSGLDGQVGALYVRAIEKYQPSSSQVAAVHTQLIDSISSWDPSTAQQAVIGHYLDDQLAQGATGEHVLAVSESILHHLKMAAS